MQELTADDTHIALETWARWAKSALSGLGFPSISIIGKCVKFGIHGAVAQLCGGGLRLLEIDETCELVDKAIMRLDETEREVVMRTYLQNDAAPVTAKKCELTYQYYRNVLSRARERIRDYLDGAKLKYVV